jgi:hypothetical protein
MASGSNSRKSDLHGFCLELDGIQHYEYPNPFHRRDEMKNRKCLIRYDVENLEGYIRKELNTCFLLRDKRIIT